MFYPESLAEYLIRRELPDPERDDPYTIIKNLEFPPGDARRYGAVSDSAPTHLVAGEPKAGA